MTDKPKDDNSMDSRYQRARTLEQETFAENLIFNARVYPNWISGSHCFWYIRRARNGNQFRLVDAKTVTNSEAFDHVALAQALSQIANQEVNAQDLPIKQVKMELSPFRLTFNAFSKHWYFDADTKTCKEISVNPEYWLVSPDGKKAVFLRNYNLWLRDLENGEEHALTTDGEQDYAYATLPQRTSLVDDLQGPLPPQTPDALWSPDSTRLFTMQVDERQVLPLPLLQYVPQGTDARPRCVHPKYGLPGDKHIAAYRMLAIEVANNKTYEAHYPKVPDAVLFAGPFRGKRAWWNKDNRLAYFVDMARGLKLARVVEFDTHTGATRVLFEETAKTYIDLNLNFESPASLLPLPNSDELIWLSERNGWAHLYLYDLQTGKLKNSITKGDWLVREVLQFDPISREVFIQAAGRVTEHDPYYREICRVNVDTGAITTLSSSDDDYVVYKPGNHEVAVGIFLGLATDISAGVSPDNMYLVSTRSRADKAPMTLLLDRNGNTLLEIESADITSLPEGWQWPEPVKLLAEDGKTDIYGIIFRPSDFDPRKSYPVIDIAFTNPFYAAVPKGAFGIDVMSGYFYQSAAAYAELGFVVVMIDGRGSCYRNKEFHDHAYGQVQKGSDLADHVAGINQLAERHTYMDINRVGILDDGGSYGPVYGMLRYPAFYKVGVVTSIWDPRLVMQGDIYQGLGAENEQALPGYLAENLQGKLLLIQGLLDPFFHAAGMYQLVDALVKENKDFDLVMLPTGGHAWDTNNYGLRRVWDYMVRNLLGIEPPLHFQLKNSSEIVMEKIMASQ